MSVMGRDTVNNKVIIGVEVKVFRDRGSGKTIYMMIENLAKL